MINELEVFKTVEFSFLDVLRHAGYDERNGSSIGITLLKKKNYKASNTKITEWNGSSIGITYPQI